eukprot:GHRR01023064.1.p1 GENE.GHRR01023064.1~~GHRR01023064.1.p1  ORF type:complete len:263 (+),score=118.01 GHRR01023064.1:492-1280(+)
MEERQLVGSTTNSNPFERNKHDIFRFKAADIGPPLSATVRLIEKGLGAAWYLDRIEVVNTANNGTAAFVCKNWLQQTKANPQAKVLLPATQVYWPEAQQHQQQQEKRDQPSHQQELYGAGKAPDKQHRQQQQLLQETSQQELQQQKQVAAGTQPTQNGQMQQPRQESPPQQPQQQPPAQQSKQQSPQQQPPPSQELVPRVAPGPQPTCSWQSCSAPYPDDPNYVVTYYYNTSTGVSQYEAPAEYLQWQNAHHQWLKRQQDPV